MISGRIALALLLGAALAGPASTEEGKIMGVMFGDYYWVASADSADSGMPEKRNAFQFRRVYFTYEKGVDDDLSIRLRLEANDKGFGAGDKMTPFVKHGYLKWKEGVAGADLYLGLSGTPTWGMSEKVWGYRFVEKTILDLNGIGSSADIGVALNGKAGKLGYHLMVGNGPGQKPESDNGKKFYGEANLKAADGVLLEGYVDFNMRPADKNELTVKGLAGVQKENFHGGIEAFMRTNKEAGTKKEAGGDVTITGVSIFGALGLADQLKGFGRVDMVSNNDEDTTDKLVIAGLDHMPTEKVHLVPNVIVGLPDGPDPNIQVRLTFSYKF